MTHRSKIAAFSILGLIAVFLPLYLGVSHAVSLEPLLESQIRLWAAFFLKLLGLSVAMMIVITLAFQAYLKIVHHDSVFTVTDERDRLIESKATRNFSFVFSFGYFFGLLLVALGKPIPLLFHVFSFTYLAGGITLSLSHIFHYERGH